MRTFIKKLFDVLRLYRYGIFSIIFHKLFSEIFSCQTLYVYFYDLKRKNAADFPDNELVTIKKITNAEDELFKKFRKKFPAREFLTRIQQPNKTCYVALQNEEIVAYGWVAFEELFIETINYWYPLKNDEFFIYACFVCKENRGEGIYPTLLRRILNDNKAENKYTFAFIGVSSANIGSIRGIKKAGFEKYNRIRNIRLLNKEKWTGIENELEPKILKKKYLS